MELAWSVDRAGYGTAMEPATGTVYALRRRGDCLLLSPDGTTQGTARFPVEGYALRPANLVRGGDSELVAFGRWHGGVSAVTSTGGLLWTYPVGEGVDDVWVGDVNSDGLDEVTIGYNGGTGLHVVDAQGNLLWRNTDLGNCWHVCTWDPGGGGVVRVLSTSADGTVSVFDGRTGASAGPIRVPLYAYLVRPVYGQTRSGTRLIVAGHGLGSAGSGTGAGEAVVGLTAAGGTTWQFTGLGGQSISGGESARSRPWVAIATHEGGVYVLDADRGMLIASGKFGAASDVTWLEWSQGSEPLLAITAVGEGLQVLRVVGPSAPTPGATGR
jgi:hypothetical protein